MRDVPLLFCLTMVLHLGPCFQIVSLCLSDTLCQNFYLSFETVFILKIRDVFLACFTSRRVACMRERSLSPYRFPIHFYGLYCLGIESKIIENENALSAWWLVKSVSWLHSVSATHHAIVTRRSTHKRAKNVTESMFLYQRK